MKVFQVLNTVYREVDKLEDFLRLRISEEYGNRLVCAHDSQDYMSLLMEGRVCTEHGTPETVHQFSCSQLSSQSDVISRIVKKLKTKKSHMKNLLMFGFDQMSKNPVAQVSSCTSVEYVYPNHHISRLQLPAWNTLLQRIGDDLMAHLLETRVIFIPADNSCWIQVTGRPLYDMWRYPTILKLTDTKGKHQADVSKQSGRTENGPHVDRCERSGSGRNGHQAGGRVIESGIRRHNSNRQGTSSHLVTRARWRGRQCDKKKKKGRIKQAKEILPKLRPIHEVLLERSADHKKHYMDLHPDTDDLDDIDDLGLRQDCVNIKRKRVVADEATKKCKRQKLHTDVEKEILGPSSEIPEESASQRNRISCSTTSKYHDSSDSNQENSAFLPSTRRCHSTSHRVEASTRNRSLDPLRKDVAKGLDGSEANRRDLDWHISDIGGRISNCNEAGIQSTSGGVRHHHQRQFQGHLTGDLNMTRQRKNLFPRIQSPNYHESTVNSPINITSTNSTDPESTDGGAPYWSDPDVTSLQSDTTLHYIDFSPAGTTPDSSQSCLVSQNSIRLLSQTSVADHRLKQTPEFDSARFSSQGSFRTASSSLPPSGGRVTEEMLVHQIGGHLEHGNEQRTPAGAADAPANRELVIDTQIPGAAVRKLKFSSLAMFDKTTMFYTRDMREKFPVGSVSQLLARGSQAVMADILNTTLVQTVDCLCKSDKADRGTGRNQSYLATANQQQLQALLDKLIQLINKSQKLVALLLSQCSQVLPPAVSTKNYTKDDHSPGASTIPDLSAPVFIRGSFRSPAHRDSNKSGASNRSNQLVSPEATRGSQPPVTASCESGAEVSLQKLSDSVLRELEKDMKEPEKSTDEHRMAELLETCLSISQVKRFMRLTLSKMLPVALLGRKNTKLFSRGVERFLELGRFEKFYVGCLTRGMQTSSIPWMTGLSHSEQAHCLHQVTAWLHSHLVMPILKSYFYITESSVHRNQMFYYRKQTWKIIRTLAMKEYLSKGNLRPISKEEVQTMISSNKSLGVSQLRFLPKSSTVRPIVNLGAQHSLCKKAINRQLQFLHSVLTYEKTSEMLGSSQFGLDDIYATWRRFVQERHMNGDERPLYFTKVDIEGCYDSISQVKLFSIIRSILAQAGTSDYVMRRYCTVLASGGQVKRTFRRAVCPLGDYVPDFTQFVNRLVSTNQHRGLILVDQVLHAHQSHTELLTQLHAHLYGNIVMVGEDYYLQTSGIVQGSMISTLLCNYYYAAMERDHLVLLGDELLMRQADDFLFVTPYKENATKFLQTMISGIPAYNCKVNAKKTLTNLPPDVDQITCLPPHALFPWCGMLFDSQSLEVRVDYTRYDGLALRDLMTLELHREPGTNMAAKLNTSLRTKCHGMFLDPEINSLPVMVENIFNMFLLSAFKFHYNARKLPQKRRVRKNDSFLSDMIHKLPTYFRHCMQNKMVVKNDPVVHLMDLRWLCYKAYILKLQHHPSVYPGLLTWLRRQVIRLDKQVKIPATAIPSELPQEFGGLLQT